MIPGKASHGEGEETRNNGKKHEHHRCEFDLL
jgi:hypothetical protein